jgi:hypothetical protein
MTRYGFGSFFSSPAIMILGYFSPEAKDKICTILAHSSLLLGLLILALMYMSYWLFSTYVIYLPFFLWFLCFLSSMILQLFLLILHEQMEQEGNMSPKKIAEFHGVEYHLVFVLIYNIALVIIVLFAASKLKGKFSAPWWTILTVFGAARSIYLI